MLTSKEIKDISNFFSHAVLIWGLLLVFVTVFFRRVAVLRGRVLSQQGLGVVGVRVSVDRHPRLGFTLTRHGGW
jgi:hypothetical protein